MKIYQHKSFFYSNVKKLNTNFDKIISFLIVPICLIFYVVCDVWYVLDSSNLLKAKKIIM